MEILLHLKGLHGAIDDVEIDLSQPRPDWLLQKTGGSTALPVLDCGKHVLRESTVILRYVDSQFPERRIRHPDPLKHAIESMLGVMDSEYAKAGYALLRNRDQTRREDFRRAVDAQYEKLDSFLRRYGEGESFLFEEFGWAEIILTPLMKRLECLGYYEGYSIPDRLDRVRRWHSACLSHPAAQSRTLEEIVKLYYDYSRDVGGGALVPGRSKSSFTMDPHWSSRPWPPKDKWGQGASDSELGLA